MPYSYNYAVKDVLIDLDFGKKESSDGTVVTGSYYVLLPDGRNQTVTYKADINGNFVNIMGRVQYFYLMIETFDD